MAKSNAESGTYTVDYFKSDTHRGVLLKDTMTDNIVTAMINMGAEMWAYRRRMLVMEQLMLERGGITPEMIEKYVPSETLMKSWEAERDRFIGNVYDVLARPADIPVTAEMNYTDPKEKGN
ncbi:MAG: hypothetical protein P8L79_13385 [Rhodospirillaceae bacterium]|jgi:hypothetical protein|nr:hypothetical protein [Rhodospirillaceae bacterium]|tara:strand:- start:165 stop:527 length:363 start_codon:yes stop_codon:yes gene_type:complete